MKLAFYGGEVGDHNHIIDQETFSLCKKDPTVTFIPSTAYEGEVDFFAFVRDKKRLRVKRYIYFPIDIPMDEVISAEVFKGDVIHLAGGNTFYFLEFLRKKKLIPKLKAFVARGGILSGVSAGAILMTPSIMTANFPRFDRDENEFRLKNLTALGLVDFEFFPHYKNSKRYEKAMLKHSKKTSNPLYACPDGSGIVIDGERLVFIGKVYCFFNGKKLLL